MSEQVKRWSADGYERREDPEGPYVLFKDYARAVARVEELEKVTRALPEQAHVVQAWDDLRAQLQASQERVRELETELEGTLEVGGYQHFSQQRDRLQRECDRFRGAAEELRAKLQEAEARAEKAEGMVNSQRGTISGQDWRNQHNVKAAQERISELEAKLAASQEALRASIDGGMELAQERDAARAERDSLLANLGEAEERAQMYMEDVTSEMVAKEEARAEVEQQAERTEHWRQQWTAEKKENARLREALERLMAEMESYLYGEGAEVNPSACDAMRLCKAALAGDGGEGES